jgi:dephospho-CoA kinase
MDETDARNRIANQASREKRLAIATHVIDNSEGVDSLREQVADVWSTITG